MPVKNNPIQLYNDLDEVLNKPPRKMIHYGNILLLLVIIMVCCISFNVKHEDVIECSATILPQNYTALQTPPIGTTVIKSFLKKDRLLKKGDTVIILKAAEELPAKDSAASKEICILAPYDCKISVNRMPEPGELLQPATLLANVTGGQTRFDVKIEIAEADAGKIGIGLKVKTGSGFFPQTEYGLPVCTIISIPYFDSSLKKTVADARLEFINKTGNAQHSCFVFKKTVTAAIVCGNKSLASGFLDF